MSSTHHHMNSRLFGPVFWSFLHLNAAQYKPTLRNAKIQFNFIRNFHEFLPCDECKTHYKAHIKKLLTNSCLESREAYEKFIYDLHETVNRHVGNPPGPSFAEVQKKYRSCEAASCQQQQQKDDSTDDSSSTASNRSCAIPKGPIAPTRCEVIFKHH